MPLAVSDIIQVTAFGLKDLQNVLNTWHFRCITAPSTGTEAANLFALIDHIFDDPGGTYFDAYLALMPDDYTLQSVRAQRVTPNRTAYAERLVVTAGTGVGVAIDTSNMTWVVIKQSALAGRRGKGTQHLLLQSHEWMTNGLLNNNGAAARQTYADLLDNQQSPVPGGVYQPVIYHPNFSPNFSDITHATIKQEIRTMRRRTVGRGI